MEPKDADLVLKTLDGDSEPCGELYDRYAGLIRAICYDTTRSVTCSQDLGQDVFLRAYEKLDSLRDPEKFASWLVGIARQVCREWLRRQVKERNRYVEMDQKNLPAEVSQIDNGYIEQLHGAMLLLSYRERLALQAFYLLGEPAAETRMLLGLSRSGFYRLLERARGRLRRHLVTGRNSHE